MLCHVPLHCEMLQIVMVVGDGGDDQDAIEVVTTLACGDR